MMLATLNPTRGANDVAPTPASTTWRSQTRLGYTRGPTQICVQAGESLAAHLSAAR